MPEGIGDCSWEITAVDPDASGNSLIWHIVRPLSYGEITFMSGTDYYVTANTEIDDNNLQNSIEGNGTFMKMSLSGATALLASGASILATMFF